MYDTILTVSPNTPAEMIEECTKYSNLGQLGFVRGKTSQEQWYLLVADAWNASTLPMDEIVRDYLAVMLDRFMRRVNLFDQLNAFEYGTYLIGAKVIDETCVQDLADISLQYVAFFPRLSQYRHQPRSLAYSARIGEELYHRLARNSQDKDDWYSVAYERMAKSFARAVMILRSVCPEFVHQRKIRKVVSEAVHTPDGKKLQ
jgi:hypothetical protein